jgi:hypothetical protein
MNPISSITSSYELKKPTSKHKHEYQELCTQLEKYFGKLVWTLPHKPGFTENRIRQAARACWRQKKVGEKYFGYLYKVIQNSPIR